MGTKQNVVTIEPRHGVEALKGRNDLSHQVCLKRSSFEPLEQKTFGTHLTMSLLSGNADPELRRDARASILD